MEYLPNCLDGFRVSSSVTMNRVFLPRLSRQASPHTPSRFLLPTAANMKRGLSFSGSAGARDKTTERTFFKEATVPDLSGAVPSVATRPFSALSSGCMYTPSHGPPEAVERRRHGKNSEATRQPTWMPPRKNSWPQISGHQTASAFTLPPLYNLERDDASPRSHVLFLRTSPTLTSRFLIFAGFCNHISTSRPSKIRVEEVTETSQSPLVCSRLPSSPSVSPVVSSGAPFGGSKLYRVLVGERALHSPKHREVVLPSKDLLLLVAAEHISLQTALRQCLTAGTGENTGGESREEERVHSGCLGVRERRDGEKEEEAKVMGHAREEQNSEISPSSFSSEVSVPPLDNEGNRVDGNVNSASHERRRDDSMAIKAKRLRNFLSQRPLTWRQPVSSIVFTAIDVIADDPRSTASTLVSLVHGDTALSRESTFGEERENSSGTVQSATHSNSASPCLSLSTTIPSTSSSFTLRPSSECSPPLSGEREEELNSAATFLRDRFCAAPWKERVRVREQDVLEKHVKSFEARHEGVSLHRSHGITLVPQTPEVLQVLADIFAAKSPLYLAALQVAAMQLRSLILADELLHSVCIAGDRRSTGESQASPVDENVDSAKEPDVLRSAMPLTPEAAWSAANIEAEEQRRRFGLVEGFHDVEKAESMMWLHAAMVTAALG
ncbi:hypothetical protein CSUI_002927 [Cystoisospora suis]|uniref:Uncharacterized protein n=1 Tax=Cystoisospora suis TaxID=483139 RepID=A0A2C6L4L0_9APIC|nr:hypothetical protein CSUI_002927 [Cystoisospora suis]